MELKLYLKMLQRGWWLVLLTSLVSVIASLVVSYLAVPQYEASARFIITPSTSLTQGRDVVNSLDTLDRRSVVATYAEVINSEKILLNSQDALQIPSDVLKAYEAQAVVLPDANVLELTVTGPNPTLAAQLANAMGSQAIFFSRRLNMSFDLNFLDEAVASGNPISPVPVRDAGIAFVLGLFVGSALAILREQIRIPLEVYQQRVRTDNVTGLYNNRYFREVLNEELTRAPDDSLSLGIIEFKGLQDLSASLSFSGMQSLLQEITQMLHKELRGQDIVARWNEISFIVMLPSTSGVAAKRTFDRIYQALSKKVPLKGYDMSVFLDPHIGGSVYDNNSINAQELIAKASDSLEQTRTGSDTPVFLWSINSPFWVEN